MLLDENKRQVILSTDGKHTVIASCDDPQEAEAAYLWAVGIYDKIVARYGLKPNPTASPMRLVAPKLTGASVCAVHGKPMVKRYGPTGEFWSCPFRNSDGSFCNWRPKPVAVPR